MRRWQSHGELDDLRRNLESWVAHREDRDGERQHRTQLSAVETLIAAAADHVGSGIGASDLAQLDVYESCRTFDLRTMWLHRVWDFFREKFDQRDREDYGETLNAADQVVWSCYQPPLRLAELRMSPSAGAGPRAAVPLPFIESRYAFEAFPPTKVPPDLSRDAGVIADQLERLPMGVVRLPPLCVSAPWWLVLVAHEAGHNLQVDLAPDVDLIGTFETIVHDAVAAKATTADDASWWRRWAAEIFADVYSVLMMGPWALRALVELELRADRNMLKRRSQYPPAIVRLELLARVAEKSSIDVQDTLAGLRAHAPTEATTLVEAERERLAVVVDASLSTIPGLGTSLPDICDVRPGEFELGGEVDRWREELSWGLDTPSSGGEDEEPVARAYGPRAARLMACAGFAAWAGLARVKDDEERRSQERRLARRVLRSIIASRDETFRAEQAAPPSVKDVGRDLGAALMSAEEDLLMGSGAR